MDMTDVNLKHYAPLRFIDLTGYQYGSPYLINRNCFAMQMKPSDNTRGKEAYEKFQEVLLSCEPLSNKVWGLFAEMASPVFAQSGLQ